MHPEIARQMVAAHHQDIIALAGPRRARPGRRPRGLPLWRVTWSRVASPADARGGRAWLIVISAHRTTIRPAA
jgi:hypothetical protein